jgi:hypothetical protein
MMVLFVVTAVIQTGNFSKKILINRNYTRCSLCRLVSLLGTRCRAAEFFSASGAALSQEVPTVK